MSIRTDQIKLSKAWNKAVIKKLPVSYKKDGISYVDHTQVTQRLIALIPDVQFKLGCHIYDKYEECISDAVKRCGMRLGIGIELYDSSAWLSSYLESPDLIANKPKKEKPKPKPKPKDPVVEKAKVDLEKIIDQKDLDKAVKILEDGVNSNK